MPTTCRSDLGIALDNRTVASPSALEQFGYCYRIASACYPQERHFGIRKRLSFALRLFFLYGATLEQVDAFFSESPVRRFVGALPDFKEQVYIQQVRPYFYRNSAKDDRLHFVMSHFRLLEATHQGAVIQAMYDGSLPPIVIWEGGQELSFDVGYHSYVMKEGLLRLNFLVNGATLYRFVFWLMTHQGEPTLCIGAVQGGRGTLETNRHFTKEFWGLRPLNMAMCAIRCYAQAAGIRQIYTFEKANMWGQRISQETDLDRFWREQGATAVPRTPYLKLSVEIPRKDVADIPTRKRSAYKRRYAFLDGATMALFVQYTRYMKHATSMADEVQAS